MKNFTRPMLWRIKSIHEIIKNKNYPNCTTFCKKLETSRATINRDLDILRYELKAPLCYNKNKKGYYYDKDFELPFGNINTDDANILIQIKSLISAFENTPFYEDYQKTIENLILPLSNNLNYNILNRIEVTKRPSHNNADKTVWQCILKAINENKLIEFDYKPMDISKIKKPEDLRRCVESYQIVFDGGNTYLFAKEMNCDFPKLFSLNRIKNINLKDETFNLPSNYKLKDWNKGSKFGAFVSRFGVKKFKFEASGGVVREIEETIFSNDQKIYYDENKHRTILEFTSAAMEPIMHWLCSEPYGLIPVEPIELVAWYRLHLKMLLKSTTRTIKELRVNPDDDEEEEKLDKLLADKNTTLDDLKAFMGR